MTGLVRRGRRAFLRGLGGSLLALPLLELTNGQAWSQGMPGPKRFVTFFAHGGVISNQGKRDNFWGPNTKESSANLWAPAPGEALELGEQLSPLASLTSKLMVVQGLDNMAAVAQASGSGSHGISNAVALSAADVDGSEKSTLPSIDFLVAELLEAANPTTFGNIHVYNKFPVNYGTPYYDLSGNSVRGPSDPQAAFDLYFAGVTTGNGPSPEQLRARAERVAIVDGVIGSYQRAKNEVGQRDKTTIEAHLEHLYEIESSLKAPFVQCEPPTVSATDDPARSAELMAEIVLAALRCGVTNVANYELGDAVTPWTSVGHPISQTSNGHGLHKLQRSVGPQGDSANKFDDWLNEVRANHQWRASMFKIIAEGLDDPSFAEGDGTMLDNSLMLYTSEFSEAANHISRNIPVLLAGSAGGAFTMGRHLDFNTGSGLDYATDHSVHNLLTSIVQAFGGEVDHVGNQDARLTGPIAELTG